MIVVDESSRVPPSARVGEVVANEAYTHLLKVLSAQSRVLLVKQEECYIYAIFTSLLMRFVDDVEFYFPADESVIHMRSASRHGRSDLGANRNRMEKLRQLFLAGVE